ncbi:hypothetical protein HGRIS_004586 [Hohenbuehelia grisea]
MECILDHIGADIVCFQEMKTTRQALDKSVALPPSYDAFFSFPAAKGGYSGVAVYSKVSTAIPLSAEEGLSGSVPLPKNISCSAVRSFDAGESYPSASSLELFPTLDEVSQSPEYPHSLAYLDLEGRALVLDYGLFVLINLYCPNETSDARFPYKMNYHLMLEERVRLLVEEQHREVVVVGDLNVCAGPDDHCEGYLQVERGSMRIGGGKGDGAGGPSSGSKGDYDTEENDYMSKFVPDSRKGRGFWKHPAREWLRRWLNDDSGMLVDVLRKRFPDRKGMYTCWNTKIGARATNYGTRIDYILVTKGLLPWIKDADIMPDIKGSDHCPVWMDLYDEIESNADGISTKIQLKDVLKMTAESSSRQFVSAEHQINRLREPPALSSKWWNEFSGKQTLLSSFFTGRPNTKVGDGLSGHKSESHNPRVSRVSENKLAPSVAQPEPATQLNESNPKLNSKSSINYAKRKLASTSSSVGKSTKKAKSSITPQKKQSDGSNQAQLFSFFQKQPLGTDPAAGTIKADCPPGESFEAENDDQIAADYQFALSLSQSSSQSSGAHSGSESNNNKKAKAAWSMLLAPVEPPKCLIHGEPTTELTVNKPGPNKGKKFFICSRPVGPGYDKGRTERLREDVDPQYRCNYFKWSNELRRDMERALKTD